MKRILSFIFILLIKFCSGQDIGVVNISSPVSGCSLSATSNVRVLVFNYGPDINTNFDVTYRINGGPPVTETVVIFPPFPSSSTYNYTFSTKADLSVPGTYSFDAYTSYPGDINRNNDSVLNYTVISEAVTSGGTISGSTAVCSGTNSGSLTLTGNTGSVLYWEYSINGGSSWVNIPNTSNTNTYNNLSTGTMYRAFVQNSTCSPAFSDTAIITVDSPSQGGSVAGSAVVCPGSSGTLTLSGQTGSVLKWESSINSGASWNPIANSTTTQNYSGITDTIWYRAEIKNGSCPSTFSAIATIGIKPPTGGGTLSGSTTVCASGNSGTLSLAGQKGAILNWEYSINGGASWNTIANTASSFNFSNLTGTTLYRVQVQNCPPSAYSTIATVTVDNVSVGGSVLKDTMVCKGSSGSVTLTGYTGSITSWESSGNNGVTWNNVNNTTATQNYSNLTSPILYRAKVKSGTCPVAISSSAKISILPKVLNAGPDVTINLGTGITLNATGGASYSWSPSSGLSDPSIANPLATPLSTTTYVVAGIDTLGCSDSDAMDVTVIADYVFIIPNAITPNGDQINDEWFIENIESYPASEVFIYNSNGMEVFHAAPYMNDWAGTYNGNKLPDGTYYYVLKFKESEFLFKGNITIIGGN